MYSAYIAFTALAVLGHEILLLARDLYFLDALHSLGYPFKQATIIILIVLTGFVHNGQKDLLDHEHHRQQHYRQQDRHDTAGRQAIRHYEHRHHNIGQQLQQ